MSATDELRRLLDERGVEWMPSVFDPQHETFYSVENGVGFIVTEFPEIGRMSLACDMRITPEQAIAATLGRGTCRNVSDPPEGFLCSECGWGDFNEPSHLLAGACYVGLSRGPRYCPNCGRKVVDE